MIKIGWTPHTRAELEAAGVNFGTGDGSTSNSSPVIVYPNSDGSTGGTQYNYTAPSNSNSDPYGGIPISINVGNSAQGLESLSGVLNSGFSGLFDLIQGNTDKNNAFSAAQAQKQMDFQERMQGIAMDFNSLEAGKNRDWQEYMSNTAHQREVADLKAAGLNPVLSASGGNGAAVGSGATAAGVQGMSGAKADADQSGNAALASIYGALIGAQTQMYNANLSAKTNLAMAEMQKEASMYGAMLSADAMKYSAGTSYAASVYGSDQAAKTAQNNNPYQILTTLADAIIGNGNRGSGFGNFANNANGLLSSLNEIGKKASDAGKKVGNYIKELYN